MAEVCSERVVDTFIVLGLWSRSHEEEFCSDETASVFCGSYTLAGYFRSGVKTCDMRLISPSPDMTMTLVALSAFFTNSPSMSQK
jgi:hypothetical protein